MCETKKGPYPWTIPPENPKCSEKDSCKNKPCISFSSHCVFINLQSVTNLNLLKHIRMVADLPQLHDGVHQSLCASFALVGHYIIYNIHKKYSVIEHISFVYLHRYDLASKHQLSLKILKIRSDQFSIILMKYKLKVSFLLVQCNNISTT